MNLQHYINEIGMTMVILYSVVALMVFIIQYMLFIQSTVKIKKFAIGLGMYLFIHGGLLFYVSRTYPDIKALAIIKTCYYMVLVNVPVLPLMVVLSSIVQSLRQLRFERSLSKGYKRTTLKTLKTLGVVIPLHCRANELQQNEIEQLKHIYRDCKNDGQYPLQVRIKYCKALIAVGISNISVPHTYDITVDVLASSDDVLKVAQGAFDEAKKIIKLAPNACVFSCRKYAENLAKYLLTYHQIKCDDGDDLDSFSTVLFLLKKHQVIVDQSVLRHFYHIKQVGNDAAHGHLCDEKTATDMVEDAIAIDQWFRGNHF